MAIADAVPLTYAAAARPLRRSPGLEPALLGVLGVAIGLAYNWVPFGWADEAATLSMVTRPMDSFWLTVTQHGDAVHAAYYLLLRCWGAVFGDTIPSFRILSAFALGSATVGVWFVGRRIGTGRLPLLSALLFLTVPMATWAATEARSSSLVIAAATWLTVMLLWAADGSRLRWVLYGVAATLCIYLFVYDALLVVAHILAVLLARDLRRNALPAVLAAAGALLATAPLVAAAVRQQAQIAWVGTTVRPGTVLLEWFSTSKTYEVAAWALILAGLVLLATGRGRIRVPRSTAFWVLLLWLALPTVALVAATLAGKPLWYPRYTLMSLPAAPLLMAIACQRLKQFAVVGLVTVAAIAVPTYLQQRTETAKGFDWGFDAAFVQVHAAAGEGIYFADSADALPARPMMLEYPSAFAGYRDLALDSGAAQNLSIWDLTSSATVAADRAAGLRRVVVVGGSASTPSTAEALAAFRSQGFSVTSSAVFPHSTAYLLSRHG